MSVAQQAAKRKVESFNGQTVPSQGFTVMLFGEQASTAEKKQAYLDYSRTLMNDFYGAATVPIEKFIKKEMEMGKRQLGASFNPSFMERLLNLFTRNLNLNSDGNISAEEFAHYVELAAKVNGETGVITVADEGVAAELIVGVRGGDGKNEGEEAVLASRYLQGETLSVEEQMRFNLLSGLRKASVNKLTTTER